jgi:predicted Fe-Mo cluster-binding NifX family protein
MLIAIPCVKEQLCVHFGLCEQFALVRLDDQDNGILSVALHYLPRQMSGLIPEWLMDKNIDVVVAGVMEVVTQSLFREHNIKVITGAPVDSPENLALKYVKGSLQNNGNA